jgi:hypothetical protein
VDNTSRCRASSSGATASEGELVLKIDPALNQVQPDVHSPRDRLVAQPPRAQLLGSRNFSFASDGSHQAYAPLGIAAISRSHGLFRVEYG